MSDADLCQHYDCVRPAMTGARVCREHLFNPKATCVVFGCGRKNERSSPFCEDHSTDANRKFIGPLIPMGMGWIDFLERHWFPEQDKAQRAKEKALALHQMCAKCEGKRQRGGKTCEAHKPDNCEVFDCSDSRCADSLIFCQRHKAQYDKEVCNFDFGYQWLASLETKDEYNLVAPKKESQREVRTRVMGHWQGAFLKQMERAAVWDEPCAGDNFCEKSTIPGTKLCAAHMDTVSFPGDCAIAACPSDRANGYIVCEHHHKEHLAHHWHKNFYTALSAMNTAQQEANQKTMQQHACANKPDVCDCGNKIQIDGLKRCETCLSRPQTTCCIRGCEQKQIRDDYLCTHHREQFEALIKAHLNRRDWHYSDIIRAIANNPEHTMTGQPNPHNPAAPCEICQDDLAQFSGLSRRCSGCLLSGAVVHARPVTVLTTHCAVEGCGDARMDRHEFCEPHRKQWAQHLDKEVGLRTSIEAARFVTVIHSFFNALYLERTKAMQQNNSKPQASATAIPQPTTGDLLLGDATESARRLAAKQFIKLTREPMIAFLAGHLDKDDPSMRVKVAAFLDTELGEGLVAALLSLGVSLLPVEHPEIKTLAQQLRIKAMTDMGDVVADLLMGPLRAFMSTVIKGAPLAALPAGTDNVTVPTFVEVPQPVQVNG